jgi:hypothetical protein
MKVPVSENPPSGRPVIVGDFPKTSVDLDYLLSQFPALYSDFAIVSALSCLSALEIARRPLHARLRPIMKFTVQPKFTTIRLLPKSFTREDSRKLTFP